MAKKTNHKYKDYKKYIYLIGIVLIVIFGLLYFQSWYKVKNKERLMESYLIKTNTITSEIKNINEIKEVLLESPSDYFIFIGYKNDEKEYNLEKKMKKIIMDYELADIFYYVDITNDKNTDDLLSKLNETFDTKDIKNTPCILYYKNNKLESIIQKENDVFDIDEFTNLLKKQNF